MKYKATLVGVPDLERPKQIFGADLAELEKWAESCSHGADSCVWIPEDSRGFSIDRDLLEGV